MAGTVRTVTHVVTRCPICGGQHRILLLVRDRQGQGPLLFGGPSGATIEATCPVSGRRFSISPHLGENDEFVGTADAEDASAPDPEYAEWVRSSRVVALDFSRTMLTTSATAVAVYFAVLNYLGTDSLKESGASWLGLAAPVLFLLAVGAFALALRPRLASVPESEFARFRAGRLRELNRWLSVGLALFVGGLVLAFVTYAWALGVV